MQNDAIAFVIPAGHRSRLPHAIEWRKCASVILSLSIVASIVSGSKGAFVNSAVVFKGPFYFVRSKKSISSFGMILRL